MNILIENYLNFLFEQNTAFAKKIRQGKLSPQAIQKLKDTGVIKPWEHYQKGMRKGFTNVVHKSDATMEFNKAYTPGESFTRPSNTPGFQRVVIGSKKEPLVNKITKNVIEPEFIERHEASEARAAQRQAKAKGEVKKMPLTLKGQLVGQHGSPRVLRGEKKIIDYTTRTYGKGEALKKYRQDSGEYKWIENTSKSKQNRQVKQVANEPKGARAREIHASEVRMKQTLDKIESLNNEISELNKSDKSALQKMKEKSELRDRIRLYYDQYKKLEKGLNSLKSINL